MGSGTHSGERAAGGHARAGSAELLHVSMVFAAAGLAGKALDWLEKAYADRDPNMPFIGCNPIFDPLRGEPRFQALLRKMNLPAS